MDQNHVYLSMNFLLKSIKQLSVKEQANLIAEVTKAIPKEEKEKLLIEIINNDNEYISHQILDYLIFFLSKDRGKILQKSNENKDALFISDNNLDYTTKKKTNIHFISIQVHNKMNFEEFVMQLDKLNEFEIEELQFLSNFLFQWVNDLMKKQ